MLSLKLRYVFVFFVTCHQSRLEMEAQFILTGAFVPAAVRNPT